MQPRRSVEEHAGVSSRIANEAATDLHDAVEPRKRDRTPDGGMQRILSVLSYAPVATGPDHGGDIEPLDAGNPPSGAELTRGAIHHDEFPALLRRCLTRGAIEARRYVQRIIVNL